MVRLDKCIANDIRGDNSVCDFGVLACLETRRACGEELRCPTD